MSNELVAPVASPLSFAVEEISTLSAQRRRPEETLADIVQLIRKRFRVDVCSVYLIEPDRSTLVLAATVGLRPEGIGRVRMQLDEGLTGLAAEQMRPIMVE